MLISGEEKRLDWIADELKRLAKLFLGGYTI